MEQASNSGADFLHEDVIKTAHEGDLFNFLTESDQTIKARTLILEYQVKESAVQLHLGRRVKEIIGRDSVKGVVMDNDETLNVNGVFIENEMRGRWHSHAGFFKWPIDIIQEAT